MDDRSQPSAPARSAPPEERVRALFDDIVARYDLLNAVLSLGLDGWWRRAAVTSLRAAPGDLVLDMGCGTGELTRALAATSRVIGVDISEGMLSVARRRGLPGRIRFVRGSAFRLPFADASFDGAASAFVLRNLDDLSAAFAELARVVVDGGRVALVDITEPRSPLLRKAFDAYFGRAAPFLGAMVGKHDAYRYLVDSLAQLPRPATMVAALEAKGFEGAAARPLSGGIVTLFTGRRSGRGTG